MTSGSVEIADASKLAAAISSAAMKSRTEEDLKIRVEALLAAALEGLGIGSDVRYETTYKDRNIVKGRSDAVYGHVVIEYERVGTFRTKAGIAHAEEQLHDYMRAEAGPDGLTRCVGVGIDGERIFFVRYRKGLTKVEPLPLFALPTLREQKQEGDFHRVGLYPINAESVTELLFYFRALQRRPLTAENLVRSFGPRSELARELIGTFAEALLQTSDPKTKTFFAEWDRLFGIIYGASLAKEQSDTEDLRKAYGITKKFRLKPLFFAVHTYYAIVIKVLAVELLSLQQGSLISSFVAGATALSNAKLKKQFDDLEHGGLFARLGVRNFLEGDFFGWYVSTWNDDVAQALRNLTREMEAFEPASGSIDPIATRDLLKDLYEDLVPRTLRHHLGEYYTPDWLAEVTLETSGYDGDVTKRFLDPSCGSGTFLVLAIGRAMRYSDEHLVRPERAVDSILSNIVGFDLNPLAVIAARTNYLLALGSLIRYKTPLELPVYMCDAVLTPDQHVGKQLDLRHYDSYSIPTSVAEFFIPREVVKEDRLAMVVELVEDSVRDGTQVKTFSKRLRAAWPSISDDTASTLEELYTELKTLEEQGKNGIWARFLKNAFAPVFVGRFDYVVGNPPWVGWESLSAEYRTATAPLWNHYGLFSLKGLNAILGGGKKDLSMLFVYVAMDNYLKKYGRLTFVINQSVLKSKGAGDGFRRFQIGNERFFHVDKVKDFSLLKPFQGASNQTVVLSAARDEEQHYPVPVESWKKSGTASLRDADTLDVAMAKTARFALKAYPIDDDKKTSPWLTIPANLEELRQVIGPSGYTAHAGTSTWLNGVFFLNILGVRPDGLLEVENLSGAGDAELRAVRALIEPELVYPLARMADVRRWSVEPSAYILLPQDPKTKAGYDEDWLATTLPHTHKYLKLFKKEISERPGLTRYHEGKAWYSIYNVDAYTFSPVKVMWQTMIPRFNACVAKAKIDEYLGKKPIVTQHVVTEIEFDHTEEAYFVCGFMNSSVASLISQSYSTGKSFGTPSSLGFVGCPKFDARTSDHSTLSRLARDASTKDSDDRDEEALQVEIDRLVGAILGLSARATMRIAKAVR